MAFIGGIFLFFCLLSLILSFWILKPERRLLGPVIGVVEIRGLITRADEKIRILEDFRRRREIRAVVVRIDSPGGAVGASQELYQELKRVAQEKPVVVSMGSVAASGGYYVALGGTRILASPGTITGSIGVIFEVPNVERLLKRLGVEPVVLKSGRFKDLVSYYRSPGPQEKKILQGVLDEIHEQFIRAVAASRKLKIEEVRRIADGRIFTGEKALRLGLVDELGNFARAVEEAARMAGIRGTPRLVYGKGEQRWWLSLLKGKTSLAWENVLFCPLYLWWAGK
ncbi:signal peptide peptidase SppA [Thermosulfurimonas sp.]|uniref:signal peptide peptidase SppA n=1 Tax=Thermosulfurimonas sp. TaxID=2080236 RepID=UPI0025D02BFA|nr:signal peptide peptidase SppA [Thermosulfurimonas sp.]